MQWLNRESGYGLQGQSVPVFTLGGILLKKRRDMAFSAFFLAPALIVFVLLIIIPIVMTLEYSLTSWRGVGEMNFVGLENYIKLFQDRNYITTVLNSFILLIIGLVVQLSFGMVGAFLVSRLNRGYKFYRSVYYLPSIISAAAMALLFSIFFNADMGPFNEILSALGFGDSIAGRSWLSDSSVVIYFVAVPQIWQYMGQQFIIYLAAVQNIPEELFESASLDGASSAKMFFKITVPSLRPITSVVVILIITGCLKAFDYPWIMTTGGPGYSSSYMAVMMYREVFKNGHFGYGSAVAMSILFISLILVVIYNQANDSLGSEKNQEKRARRRRMKI